MCKRRVAGGAREAARRRLTGAPDPGYEPGMSIDRERVRRVARLAHLELPEDAPGGERLLDDARLDRLAADLGAILDHVARLDALDLEGVPPTTHGTEPGPGLRPDVVGPTLDRRTALAGAPQSDEGGFCVPKVIE